MKKTLLTIIITAVIVGSGIYFWQTKNTTVSDEEKQEYLVSTLELFKIAQGAIVLNSGPAEGADSVTIDNVLLPLEGFVKIFKNGNTEIGTSNVLSIGRHDNVVVTLTETLEKTNLKDVNSKYVIALYDKESLSPILNPSTGNPVETFFTISE